MTLMQIPMKVTAFLTDFSSNKYVILALINVLLLFLGTLMDMSPLILILTPILLPDGSIPWPQVRQAPARWPATRGRLRDRAQRPFPSITMAT